MQPLLVTILILTNDIKDIYNPQNRIGQKYFIMKKILYFSFIFLVITFKVAFPQIGVSSADTNYLIVKCYATYNIDSLGFTYSLHPNGAIESKGKMVEKRDILFRKYFYKNGVWKYYSIDNKLIKEEYYEKSKLI